MFLAKDLVQIKCILIFIDYDVYVLLKDVGRGIKYNFSNPRVGYPVAGHPVAGHPVVGAECAVTMDMLRVFFLLLHSKPAWY